MINNAKWICVPDEFVCECPDFRRNINITGILKRAILSIACVGVYECRINGKKVGDEVLTPGWSNFNDHAFVREYDVTDMMTNQTELSITCGRGWGAGKIGMDVWDNVYSRKILCRYSLDLEFEDLIKSEIISDSNTEVWTSCTTYSDLYHGEIVDNTVKPYKLAMAETTEFKTKLVPFSGEKIKEQETIHPLKEIITPKGERVIDFGQNMAGYIKIRVNGNCGDRIVIRHAEVLDKDGNFYTDNMRIAKNLISYTLNGTEQEVCPRFSYQGFRYICLDECPKSIQTKDFTAIAVYSDMKRTGDFICGNDKLNKLYENIIWGQRSNFLDIPTDCPQRDERLGWTGDAQIFARTAAINYNVQKFYEKWLYELRSEQHEDGSIPAVIPDCLKQYQDRISSAWGDASVIVPWELYRAYGDRQILRDNYECMRLWIEYVRNAGENEYLWLGGDHYGDWLAMDNPGSMEGKTDKDFIASCFYANSVKLFIKSGRALEKDMTEYECLYKNIVKNIRQYFPIGKKSVLDTQTVYVLLIAFDIAEDYEEAGQRLVKLIKDNGMRLTTGFVGTPYLLHALSRTNNIDIAYELLFSEQCPSWLYSINHGATTIWEHWDSIKEDGSFWPANMNSFNHYAYGSVFDWIFETVGGIDILDGGEGYSKIKISPIPNPKIGFAQTSIETANGKIISKWKYYKDYIRYEFDIPDRVAAYVDIEGERKDIPNGGKYVFYSEIQR